MCASTLWPFSSSMRNIALGRGSITRPSTSMAPSFLAILCGDPPYPLSLGALPPQATTKIRRNFRSDYKTQAGSEKFQDRARRSRRGCRTVGRYYPVDGHPQNRRHRPPPARAPSATTRKGRRCLRDTTPATRCLVTSPLNLTSYSRACRTSERLGIADLAGSLRAGLLAATSAHSPSTRRGRQTGPTEWDVHDRRSFAQARPRPLRRVDRRADTARAGRGDREARLPGAVGRRFPGRRARL